MEVAMDSTSVTPGHDLVAQKMQERATANFVDAKPIMVSFVRTRSGRNERGGYDRNQKVVIPPQKVCILHAPPRRRRLENQPPHLSLEEVPFAKDAIMGEKDLDVQLGDEFDVGDIHYKVEYVFNDRTWETIANISSQDQVAGT
jgi:hypothetical protein